MSKTTSAAALAAALLAEIGDNHPASAVTHFIDTGAPELNKKMSGRSDGGLPFGRLVEMYGGSSSGKTALATRWMAAAQAMGGIAGFTDWERSFSVELAQAGFGLNVERPFWLYNKAKTWEEGNTIAAKACRVIRASKAIPEDAPILWVFDSIASAIPQSSAGKDMSELNMNDTTALARVTSTTLKVMAQIAEECNATFLYLNQIRTKPGVVYGDPTTTPGGGAMEYYSTVRLALGRSKVQKQVDGKKQFVGQDISVKVAKSKLTKPFQVADLRMTFDDMNVAHFDMAYSTIDWLVKEGKLIKEGNYIVWIDGKKYNHEPLAKLINDGGLHHELAKIAAS